MRGPRFRRRPRVAVAKPRPGGAAKRAPKPKQPFDPGAAWATAQAILAAPPHKPNIVRRESVGALVARWLLPLDCAPTTNAQIKMARNSPWVLDALKKRVLVRMLRQSGGKRAPAPLAGRPHVRVVIFSSGREDYDRSRTKIIVDRLQRGHRQRPSIIPLAQWRKAEAELPPLELGWLAGDGVKDIDLATWQETCAPGKGCVLVELYTGETT